MSKEVEEIKEQMGIFSGKYAPSSIVQATVLSVDEDEDTVSVKMADESEIDDVRLKAILKDGNKVLLIPKVGSEVLIGRIQNSDECVVVSVHEVSAVIYLIDDVSHKMNGTEILTEIQTVKYKLSADGFLIKKGNDTLKQVIQMVIESQQQIVVMYGNNPDYGKLAQALIKLNNLLQ